MLEKGSKCSVCPVATAFFANHQVNCGSNGDHIHCHDSLRNVLLFAFQSASLTLRMEEPFLIPGISSHLADLFLLYWSHGRPAALDDNVTSPLQKAQD